jgi:hypothetical protein
MIQNQKAFFHSSIWSRIISIAKEVGPLPLIATCSFDLKQIYSKRGGAGMSCNSGTHAFIPGGSERFELLDSFCPPSVSKSCQNPRLSDDFLIKMWSPNLDQPPYCTVPYQKKATPLAIFCKVAVKLITLISSVLIRNDSNDIKFCRNNGLKV